MSVTCCGQGAQSVSDTSGGRSGTQSCWWMVDQICTDPIWPPTPECVVLRTLLQLACMWNAKSPTSSVHRECFEFRGCDAALSQCALQTVLVSLVLPTRMPEAMMKLPIEDLLGNSCVIHTNDMSTPSELCSLQKCLNSTDVE